jgi:hypothetical protein
MHDGDDVYMVRFDAIQETVGELRNQNPPEQAAKGRAGDRVREQAFIRPLNREGELESESLASGPRRTALLKRTRSVRLDEAQRFSPKRGADLLHDPFGRNRGNLAGLDLC